MKIYHNPNCSKSKKALQIIESQGILPEIIYYINTLLEKVQIHCQIQVQLTQISHYQAFMKCEFQNSTVE